MKFVVLLFVSIFAAAVNADGEATCKFPDEIPDLWEKVIEKCNHLWNKTKFNYCYAECVMEVAECLTPEKKWSPAFSLEKAMNGISPGKFKDEFMKAGTSCIAEFSANIDPKPAECMGYKEITDCFMTRMCTNCHLYDKCEAAVFK